MSGSFDVESVPEDVVDVTSLGKGIKLIKTETVKFDRDRANWLLISLAEFKGDRILSAQHVRELASAMKRGTFRPEFVSLIVCKYGRQLYRMNGQHTAWARLSMDDDFEDFEVTVLTYEAKSMNDVRILYASIDRNANRSRTEVTNAYLAGSDQFGEFTASTQKRLPQAFAFYNWSDAKERRQYDGDALSYFLLTTHKTMAKRVASYLEECNPADHRHILKTPVIAALFATFNEAVAASREFWDPVADGTGFSSKNDPRNRLRAKLLEVMRLTGKKRPKPEAVYQACLRAWNAWREGDELASLRVKAADERPEVHK